MRLRSNCDLPQVIGPFRNGFRSLRLLPAGRSLLYRDTPREIALARDMFTRAVAHDPDYALAHSGLADAASYLYMHAGRRPQRPGRSDLGGGARGAGRAEACRGTRRARPGTVPVEPA